jgi:predicted N-acetyltransferase YhbS
MSLAAATSPPTLAAEGPEDAAAVEALVLAAFGPGRYAKAAERLREHGETPLPGCSFLAWDAGRLVGCVRMWAVSVAGAPAVLLGPIAVDPAYRHHGHGGALIDCACAAAAAAGHTLIVLVGDMPLFGPHGFTPAPKLAMPGPVDPRRVLARALSADAPAAEGLVAVDAGLRPLRLVAPD